MKKQNTKSQKTKLLLNREEKELLSSVEQGEWKRISNIKEEIEEAKQAAFNTLRKKAQINIRISTIDLAGLKQKAAYEGLPYQTLITSVLHKYISECRNNN